LANLSRSDFAVGEQWEMAGAEGAWPVELIAASDLADSGREGGSFRLEFRGPFEPVLPQAIYNFRREGAEHEIFVTPIAREEAGTRYEAVFF
jgi:hypothetical protein